MIVLFLIPARGQSQAVGLVVKQKGMSLVAL
jgi:hypothetical protein